MSWSYTLPKRKVFVSYHHKGDQAYYDAFSQIFHDTYETITDNSLMRAVDSDDPQYVMRRIRENHITGTSCTIVLCGTETPYRKYVDWEISATLEKQHGLVGVKLPTLPVVNNGCSKPARLQDNIDSGYAVWAHWESILNDPSELGILIEQANSRSKLLINNSRDRRKANG